MVGDLTFTMEVMSDFPDSTIPTLDFSLWLETQEGVPKLSYRFFSKPMSSRYAVLESSAWAWSSKCASLAQEVHRRLQNTAGDQPLDTKLEILEEFHRKLTRSGYSRVQVRQVMEAGIKGYHNKLSRGLVHRQLSTIQENREIRKILEKSTWYLPKTRASEESPGTPSTGWGPGGRRRKTAPGRTRNPFAPKAPLFIPRTHNGALIERLRQVEEGLTTRRGSRTSIPRVKLVEQAGVMVKSLLTNEDPWSCRPCSQPQCTTCSGDKTGDCRTRSVVYSNTCLLCSKEGRYIKYIGETNRTMTERSLKHQSDALTLSQNTHMRDHMTSTHPFNLEEILTR